MNGIKRCPDLIRYRFFSSILCFCKENEVYKAFLKIGAKSLLFLQVVINSNHVLSNDKQYKRLEE